MIGRLLATEQRSAIERWCRQQARAIAMPSGRTLACVLGSHKMVLDLTDLSVAPHLAVDGYWEIWNAMALAKRVKKGWNAIDVGANFGYYSLLLADLVDGGQVEAWEPNPRLTDLMQQTFSLNDPNRFRLVRCGASDTKKSGLVLTSPSIEDFGSARVNHENTVADAPRLGAPGSLSLFCEVDRLDSTGLSSVDFIKIDTEGAEPLVWKGMRGILARGEPKAMLMEWSPWRYDAPAEFLAEIQAAGFSVGVVDGQGDIQAPVGDITTLEESAGHLDLWLERR